MMEEDVILSHGHRESGVPPGLLRRWVAAAAGVLMACVVISGFATAADPPIEGPEFRLPNIWQGDLDGMAQRRLIRVLTVFSKTNYFLDGAQQRGATYELVEAFDDFINRTMKASRTQPIRVVIVPVSRDQLLPALAAGRGDIAAANLTVSSDRQATVSFSDPLIEQVNEVIVTGPLSPAITGIEDLAGMTIHVRRSSSYWQSLETLNTTFAARGLAPITLSPADEALEDEDILEMVSAGILPLAVVDDHLARFWAGILKGLVIHEDVTVHRGGAIAWAVRKDAPELLAAVNHFIPKAKYGSEFGNTLARRYFRDNKWVRNPTASADFQRFRAAAALFQRYAADYDFDWLMIAAQAYQESGLDQSARSRVGAIGVMQLEPATAADPNIGIRDISDLDDNIHAGTKYLRFLVQQHFNDPAINSLNRTLFALAAYNAGPSRIDQVRRQAASMGLDPNRWFGNVELAAAHAIGRETVVYVSNIAKYYYAYRLALEELEQKKAAQSQSDQE
ncbi:transglycosylase SLT domain-containing protein [Inquilinus sp. CA228]|uniref:transglycosylase SLT domain-containing protein n=1 Tax=Inquilinus sp. CA228 TaxID=3455609 RepID=UPI003F8D0474